MPIFKKLGRNIAQSVRGLTSGAFGILKKRKLDDTLIQDIETILIEADFGPTFTNDILDTLKKDRYEKETSIDDVREVLEAKLLKLFEEQKSTFSFEDIPQTPAIILLVGVNGSGKTTTGAKIAYQYKKCGKNVALVAADTFRDAAREQLQLLGELGKIPVWSTTEGSDSAALVHTSIQRAQAENFDVIIIDTAGRLHTNADLMGELAKILRTIQKFDIGAPHQTFLTLDATIGQNACQQVMNFNETVPLSGLIMTKLDGSAKGGTLVSLAQLFKLPVAMVGIGESLEDIDLFNGEEFVRSLLTVYETSEESVPQE